MISFHYLREVKSYWNYFTVIFKVYQKLLWIILLELQMKHLISVFFSFFLIISIYPNILLRTV